MILTHDPIISAAVKGIIEGITEFLPISSTGHLILVRDWFPLSPDPTHAEVLDNLFDVIIQLPAILAIIVLFWRRLLLPNPEKPQALFQFWLRIAAAFVPAGIIGFLLKKVLDTIMIPPVVAGALIVGGIILIWIEKRKETETTKLITTAETVPLKTGVAIGFIQCLAMIPGTSRSGATIVGGRLLGLSRTAAAEFSFFLAIPTMVGAFTLKFYKAYHLIQWRADGLIFLVGSVVSFFTALLVVSLFIKFIQRNSLAAFGWYRIILGLIVIISLR